MEAFSILTKPKRVFIFMWTLSCFLFFFLFVEKNFEWVILILAENSLHSSENIGTLGGIKPVLLFVVLQFSPRETFTGSSNTSSFLFSTYCTTSNASLTIWDLNRMDDDMILCFASKVLNLLIDLKWGWMLHIAHFKNYWLFIKLSTKLHMHQLVGLEITLKFRNLEFQGKCLRSDVCLISKVT